MVHLKRHEEARIKGAIYAVEDEEPLTEMDMLVIGKNVRITFPLASSHALREVAELMRGTAVMLDAACRTGDSERQRLCNARDALNEFRIKVTRAAAKHGIVFRKNEGGAVD